MGRFLLQKANRVVSRASTQTLVPSFKVLFDGTRERGGDKRRRGGKRAWGKSFKGLDNVQKGDYFLLAKIMGAGRAAGTLIVLFPAILVVVHAVVELGYC